MKERPILFNGEMVRAILEGRKTQTRRVVKPQPAGARAVALPDGWGFDLVTDRKGQPQRYHETIRCPYGQPGDRLWVREAFRSRRVDGLPGDVMYRADHPGEKTVPGSYGRSWKPSIHMPRWASRLLLEIVSVRVERLQAIDAAGAAAEGVTVPRDSEGNLLIDVSSKFSPAKYMQGSGTPNEHLARAFFASLWESINGDGSWAANPWVWVVEFRRLQP